MSKPILLVDLDECIFPYAINYIPWLRDAHGIIVDWPHPDGEHDHFDSNPWHGQLDSAFINDRATQNIAPRADALEATIQLAEKYTLGICTARYKSSHEEASLAWISKWLPHFSFTIFTYVGFGKPGVPKGTVAKELGAVALIDDRDMHLLTLPSEVPGFLVERTRPIPSDKGALPWSDVTETLMR